MDSILNSDFAETEFLYRGVVVANWDFESNRASSSAFKDSKGASVDRLGNRSEANAIDRLLSTKDFKAIIRVSKKDVNDVDALVLYKPVPDNIYHSEIHDSIDRPQLRGSKPNKLRDKSTEVYKK